MLAAQRERALTELPISSECSILYCVPGASMNDHQVLDAGEDERREERKLWHRPAITVIDAAEETRSNSGPGGDGAITAS